MELMKPAWHSGWGEVCASFEPSFEAQRRLLHESPREHRAYCRQYNDGCRLRQAVSGGIGHQGPVPKINTVGKLSDSNEDRPG